MPKAKMSDDEWINFLKDCRSSGMTDKDWCIMHDIHPSTLYKVIFIAALMRGLLFSDLLRKLWRPWKELANKVCIL